MKRMIVSAVTLVWGISFAPVAYAVTDLDSPDAEGAGTAVEFVELDSMNPAVPQTESQQATGEVPPGGVISSPGKQTSVPHSNGSELPAPAGPQVVGQVAGPVVAGPAAPQPAMNQPAQGAVSQINPQRHTSFVTAPITSSIPSALSFFLVMLLCLGAGVGAAVIISWITGKKITLGFAGR